MTAVEKTSQGVAFSLSSSAKALVSLPSPDIVRIRIAPNGVFEPDFSYAIVNAPSSPFSLSETPEAVTVSTQGGAMVVIQRGSFRVAIRDQRGRALLEEESAHPATYNPTTSEITASFRREPTDLHYGFAEKALPLSRHGQVMTMWNTDMYRYTPGQDPLYQSISFFITLHRGLAYGVFLTIHAERFSTWENPHLNALRLAHRAVS